MDEEPSLVRIAADGPSLAVDDGRGWTHIGGRGLPSDGHWTILGEDCRRCILLFLGEDGRQWTLTGKDGRRWTFLAKMAVDGPSLAPADVDGNNDDDNTTTLPSFTNFKSKLNNLC